MKTFVVIRYHVAGSGHSVTIVKARNEQEALRAYAEHLCMDSAPIGTSIREVTQEVDTVFQYDNPNYEG